MKILLTGKDAQVGFLWCSLASLGVVIAIDFTDRDILDAEDIRQLVATVRPSVIVNLAAYTSVDKAESDQKRASAVNAVASGVCGEEALKLGARVVHYSTDYVFDGTKDGAYSEADPTNPQSIYGRTKYNGELALANTDLRHRIRTTWVVGAHGGSAAKTMLKLSAACESLNVVADQWGVDLYFVARRHCRTIDFSMVARRRRRVSVRYLPLCRRWPNQLVRLRTLRHRPSDQGWQAEENPVCGDQDHHHRLLADLCQATGRLVARYHQASTEICPRTAELAIGPLAHSQANPLTS